MPSMAKSSTLAIMNLTTPALLFPAISLLLAAYTNRFLSTAQVIRQLHTKYQSGDKELVTRQIDNLRVRIHLIRRMQMMAVGGFILCALSMFLIYLQQIGIAEIVFGCSLLMLVLSLLLSLYEIVISTRAIDIELEDMALGLEQRH